MKEPLPNKDRIIGLLVATLSRAWEAGNPVAGSTLAFRRELASIALRRWRSAARRGVQSNGDLKHVRDLACGLIAAFEENPGLVGPLRLDYECIAGELLTTIQRAGSEE